MIYELLKKSPCGEMWVETWQPQTKIPPRNPGKLAWASDMFVETSDSQSPKSPCGDIFLAINFEL